jgi:hypothetical protein
LENRGREPEVEGVAGDRGLAVTGIEMAVQAMKLMRLHIRSTEEGQRRVQRAKLTFKGL